MADANDPVINPYVWDGDDPEYAEPDLNPFPEEFKAEPVSMPTVQKKELSAEQEREIQPRHVQTNTSEL